MKKEERINWRVLFIGWNVGSHSSRGAGEMDLGIEIGSSVVDSVSRKL